MENELSQIKKLAVEAAKQAGEILMENFGKVGTIGIKKRGDLVTNVDIEIERKIIQLIQKSYPHHSILSEESKGFQGTGEYRWIIDPLDGTHNYIRCIEMFGVSIAVEWRGEVVLGVVYLPYHNQFYFAQKGKGAFLNQKKIEVSQRKLSEATLIYDSNFNLDKENLVLQNLVKLGRKVFNVRMFGSTARALTYIAEGKVDLMVEYFDKPWDFSAGALIVEEAGGKVTDTRGKPWSPRIRGYVASNGIFHEEVLSLLS